MNDDHDRMTAKPSAHPCGRSDGRGSRWRGRSHQAVAACLLAWSAMGALGSVQAQDRGGFRRDDVQQQPQQQHRDDRGDRNAQRQDAPRYESRPDDSHRQQDRQQDRGADASRRSGRLTADERRDLRRQINEAGVDLYPNTPRR